MVLIQNFVNEQKGKRGFYNGNFELFGDVLLGLATRLYVFVPTLN